MIKYNLNNINDWNFGEDNIIKVYRNNAIVFYKFDSETQEFKVCYAVVADITQYTDREFEDVYDKATEKWYKLNNLTNYEEYGIYGEGRNITYYEGKLTIDDGYEYEYSGGSWVNVGEVSGTSVTINPNDPIPFEDSRIKTLIESKTGIQNITYAQASGYTSSFNRLNIAGTAYEGAKFNELRFFTKMTSFGYTEPFYSSGELTELMLPYTFTSTDFASVGECRKLNNLVVPSGYTSSNGADFIRYGNDLTNPVITFLGSPPNYASRFIFDGTLYDITIQVPNNKVEEWKSFMNSNTSGGGSYVVGIDVEDYAYIYDPYSTGSVTYPKYYSEKSDPLNDLTFNTMEDAVDYAYNNCVYDGMKAIINGERYYFDSSDENGWVKILEYYKVEDVTPNQASGWTISGSSTYNPDSSYYDDFDLQTTSTSNVTKIAKVTIYGYDHFTYYLRTTGRTNYCYVVATNVDEIQTPPSTMSYNSSSAITNTYYWNKSPKSAVNLSNYRRVTYNNLDKTVEHTFYVYFYGRTYSSYVGNATILIPKEQTNENWEQVTFSASSNVASAQKNLYIDNNYSTSGGTQYWYYRWMVGLPSGSHSSYTNYSSYDYCPNVTSSTFTSVASEQRQVNFTYDNASYKSLSFRLTDGSNVLTPSETVYFNMTYYNSCGVSSSSGNVTFPRSQSVKVGGRFRFANSSNRHYIYGYSPNISLNYDYYVDNYQSTFDITYTKLSDEAVTITYTTYDPNDSEIPAFNTDITWPYSGGTTSSTTLTSYDVPYTYPYEVSQTSDKFSADKQSYTANQAAREISFILYPNNREFATVADMEAYQYAWEGMKATVGDKNYKYENGEWVEKQHSLPDVPFVLNYNAKQYNASTHTIPYTEGALNAIDAVITGTTANIIDHHTDGYIQLTGSSSTTIRALVGTTYFSRSSSNPNITIVCKAYTTSGTEGNILSNRKESYNWMYRHKQTVLTFHGTSEQGSIAVSSSEPNTCSVRIDSNRLLKYNNWTQNTTSSYSNFNYGSNSNGGALFSGYYSSSGEFWKGCFYWIYMTLNTLTDEQVQQVIDYNENL